MNVILVLPKPRTHLEGDSVAAAYGYARLGRKALRLVGSFARGNEVLDLGAGGGEMARLMGDLGASRVVALDHRPMRGRLGVELLQANFAELPDLRLPDRVLFSWPTNSLDCAAVDGVSQFLSKVKELLYIGCNDATTQCGWMELWNEFRERAVLGKTVVGRHNTLIHYGGRLPEMREVSELLPEERRAYKSFAADLRRFDHL